MLAEKMENVSNAKIDLLNKCLQSVLSTGKITLPEGSETILPEVLTMAKRQEVILLVYYGLKKTGSNLADTIKHELLTGVFQHSQNMHMFEKAKALFETEAISFVPLKGALVKDLYPEPWLRHSCDVDLLIREADLEKAVRALKEAGFETENKKDYHDVSLFYGGAHLELHFNICENIPRIDNTLSQVWKHTVKISEYEYHETGAFFLFHTVAHLLYHFVRGGCSLKQFLDIWLLRQKGEYDEKELKQLLSSSKLERFYETICDVSDIWFEEKEQTELSRLIEGQVLNRGLSESQNHSDSINIILEGGIRRHVFRSVFLPMRAMKWIYPVLEKRPYLLPYYYLKRIILKSIGKDRARAQDIIKAEKDKKSDDLKLLRKMGL